LHFQQVSMTVMPRLPHVLMALAALAGVVGVTRRRSAGAEARIAGLEADRQRLAGEAQQALRVRDDFLATLSHELRTPLNAMLGWVQLLRLHADDAAMRGHAIDVIERNARAQVQVMSDLLDVSRIITGRMRLDYGPVDLDDVVHAGARALTEAAAAKHVSLSIETAHIPGAVWGDAARLRQVVWNLVSNAIKFTPRGGTVRVTVRAHDAAEITVTDTGIGITQEVLPFVFDRFRQGDSSLTRRYGGLGLGLAIVKHLVELHGGTVHAKSEGRHCGASFSVRLPLQRAIATA
jgi:signal transduction histidine kinase